MSLSKVSGLDTGSESTFYAFFEALVHYVKDRYFRVLESAFHHVLYIIPMLNHGIHQLKWFKYEIVPFAHGFDDLPSEGICGRHGELFARNSVVIAGVFSDRRLAQDYWFPANMNWIGGQGQEIPHGAVCLSHRVFLATILLQNLEEINRRTTIIPKLAGVKDQEVHLELLTWNSHPIKCVDKCEWERDGEPDGKSLQFKWRNYDHLTHNHESNFDNSRRYLVDCECKSTPCSRPC